MAALPRAQCRAQRESELLASTQSIELDNARTDLHTEDVHRLFVDTAIRGRYTLRKAEKFCTLLLYTTDRDLIALCSRTAGEYGLAGGVSWWMFDASCASAGSSERAQLCNV